MAFLAPAMLIGGAAAGIPLILHFLYRARYTPVPWGAMKFLRLDVEWFAATPRETATREGAPA